MGGNKRAGKPHIARPSPLQQEVSTQTISTIRTMSTIPLAQPTELAPTSGLVRDPMFWKRFSVAIHMAEVEPDEERAKGSVKSGSTVEIKSSGDDWLNQQRKEKRRCRVVCLSITVLVVIIIAAGANDTLKTGTGNHEA
ncbi:uncharacterized protein PAC_00830 [Phialocephala subalpina]|uniref:Uncharacterized protein n=1 Tax=Phialocephala subalpina TaxID=576137 RepID=A0A1L7WDV5_9HELO|nr:uncharacterized protein PAC_00830 [Phialocephala subalpina]